VLWWWCLRPLHYESWEELGCILKHLDSGPANTYSKLKNNQHSCNRQNIFPLSWPTNQLTWRVIPPLPLLFKVLWLISNTMNYRSNSRVTYIKQILIHIVLVGISSQCYKSFIIRISYCKIFSKICKFVD